MRYVLYNVTGNLVDKPCKITDIYARNMDDAFVKVKMKISKGLRDQLGLVDRTRINFTSLCSDSSLNYGDDVKYTTCSIEDECGFVIDIYEYAIKPAV